MMKFKEMTEEKLTPEKLVNLVQNGKTIFIESIDGKFQVWFKKPTQKIGVFDFNKPGDKYFTVEEFLKGKYAKRLEYFHRFKDVSVKKENFTFKEIDKVRIDDLIKNVELDLIIEQSIMTGADGFNQNDTIWLPPGREKIINPGALSGYEQVVFPVSDDIFGEKGIKISKKGKVKITKGAEPMQVKAAFRVVHNIEVKKEEPPEMKTEPGKIVGNVELNKTQMDKEEKDELSISGMMQESYQRQFEKYTDITWRNLSLEDKMRALVAIKAPQSNQMWKKFLDK